MKKRKVEKMGNTEEHREALLHTNVRTSHMHQSVTGANWDTRPCHSNNNNRRHLRKYLTFLKFCKCFYIFQYHYID